MGANKKGTVLSILGKLRPRSIVTRNLLLTSLYIILTGAVLIAYSYYIQGDVLVKQLHSESGKIMEKWAQGLTSEEVAAAKASVDTGSDIQKKMIQFFDDLSSTHPNIAQGYLFGPELTDGNKTSMIAFPTAVLQMFDEAGMKLGDYFDQPENHVAGVEKMLKTKELTFTESYTDDYGTWVTVLHPYLDASGTVFAYMGMDVDASLVMQGKHDLLKNTLIALLITLLIVLSLQYITNRKTFTPIKELMNALEKLSRGDFNVRLKEGGDELGQVNAKFNATIETINNLISTMKAVSSASADQSKVLFSTVEINNADTTAITRSMEELSERTVVQNVTISESVTSLEEIASGVNAIADNASELSETSLRMKHQSERGNTNMEQVVSQMNSISTSVKDSVVMIEKLQSRSNEIEQIVQLITQIATQTNLLSLNASIEAARAGENGRGFAVVANEVKKLAEQSKHSADQIAMLIRTIQEETSQAVAAIALGEQNVEKGIEIVKETGALFSNIYTATDSVTSQIQEVSAATEEMVAVSEQMTASFKQLAVMSGQNSDVTEAIKLKAQAQQASFSRIVASAEQLNEVSSQLESLVVDLVV
ncbi:MAG: methyl-accepting chemotaxis sensory transducer [Paenibacillaceae bacterium]|nr:methyl-accepting chemotaxis sensory transducer [Paenibacillaceae bacterium]